MRTLLSRSVKPFMPVDGSLEGLGQGIGVSVVVAVTAQFLSEHHGAPAMLMALLLGMAFHFLSEEGRCVTGINFTASTVLRVGVALLGARISFDMLIGLGAHLVLLVIGGVIATILFALIGAKLLGRGWRLALLTGGAVAICGASAAMAIAAVLPKNQHSERNLIFTVLSLGGTIHDVAQVLGAGFSVSDTSGDPATLVKLIRVSMLAPVVLIFALLFRNSKDSVPSQNSPLVPGFVIVFFLFAGLNSIGLIPIMISSFRGDVSRWVLLTAIAAVGMKTSLKTIQDVGGLAIILIASETIFLAVFILGGIAYIR